MKKYLVFFAISVLLYLVHVFFVKHGIYGDGNGYYSLAHTIFFQPTFDLRPIYHHLSNFRGASYVFSRIFWNTSPTPTGILNCPWLVGTAYFWLPSFFVLATLGTVFHFGMFSLAYEIGCGVTGIIAVLAGLYLVELLLRTEFKEQIARNVIIALFVGSQLFYYASFEPALSHQISFFLISLILYITQRRNKAFGTFILGIATGLLAITRIGELVLVAPILIWYAATEIKSRRIHISSLAVFAVSLILGLLPQLLLQQLMYGTPFYNPYLHAEKGVFHQLSAVSLYNHLLSPGGGLLLWSPIFILAIWGFFIKQKKIKTPVRYLIALGIYYLFIASWEYVPPAGFGNRFFMSAIPFLSFGLALYFARYRSHVKYIILIAAVWNALILFQFFADSNRLVKRRGLTFINFITGQVLVPYKKATSRSFLVQ